MNFEIRSPEPPQASIHIAQHPSLQQHRHFPEVLSFPSDTSLDKVTCREGKSPGMQEEQRGLTTRFKVKLQRATKTSGSGDFSISKTLSTEKIKV